MTSNESTTVFSLKFDGDDGEIEITPESISESGYQYEFYNSIADKPVDESSNANPADTACPKCGKTYKYLALFQKHTKTCEGGSISPRETLHVCTHCQKVYKNRMSYEKHVLFCAESKSTPCLLDRSRCFCCAEPTSQAHVGNIKCTECSKMFKTPQGYSRHQLLLHAETTKFKCELCNVQCSNIYILKLHRESHKEEIERLDRNSPEYKCNVCGKCFLDTTALDIHINSHRRDDIQPTISYHCKLCNTELPTLDKFYNHLCEEDDRRKFKCEFCGRFLSSMGFYRRHINTHRKYNVLAESPVSKQKDVNLAEPPNEDDEKYEMIEIDTNTDDESNDKFSSDSRLDIKGKVMAIFDPTPLPVIEPPPQKVRILNNRTAFVQTPRILNSNAPARVEPCSVKSNVPFVQPMRVLNGTPQLRQMVNLESNNNNTTNKTTRRADMDNGMKNVSTPLTEIEFETILKNIKTDNTMDDDFFPMDNTTLRESVIGLLKVMLDAELLEAFGLYTVPVEQVLSRVLKKMEFEPFTDSYDVGVQLRENVKLLLKSVCDDTNAIRNIENIHTVDIILREIIKIST